MDWTKEQKSVIDTRQCNLLVSAAAGSGKTAVLVERIIQMVFDKNDPIDIDRLLVVTFTKAAASSMKDKIATAIEKRIDEEPNNTNYIRQLNLLRDANIMTIDSFCYKVLKEYFHVIPIDPKVVIAEASELEIIRQEVLDEVMEEMYENSDSFVKFSNAFSTDKNDLNIEEYIMKLYDMSESYPFPQKWLEDAKNNLVLEGIEGLSKMPFMKKYISEVHQYADDIKKTITKYLKLSRSDNGPKHYESALVADIEMMDDIIKTDKYNILNELSNRGFVTLKRAKKSDIYDVEFAEIIKKGRDSYKKKINELLAVFKRPFDEVEKQFETSHDMLAAYIDATILFSKRYLEKKVSLGLVGFSDVEHFALSILCDGTDEEGNPIQSKVGKELSEKYIEILIDEYQDSNYLQENILRCVSRIPRDENNIFMVGDVKQSIYGFRMARPELFTEKYNDYTDYNDWKNVNEKNIKKIIEEKENEDDIENEDDAENRDEEQNKYDIENKNDSENKDEIKIILQKNFRSRENILEFINYIFYQAMGDSVGGIDYSYNEALKFGREYPDIDDDSVEILIGETEDKNFADDKNDSNENDSNESDSNENSSNKNDDDNIKNELVFENNTYSDVLVDADKVLLEAGMVADRIEKLMGGIGCKRHLVTDDVTGKLRPIEYRDIVILFRSPKNYQPVFSEVLMKRNIPVKLQNENGYFDMVEISGLISLLKMIDNPYNDVECAAVLRGYFGALDNNEIALLYIMKKYADEIYFNNNKRDDKTDDSDKKDLFYNKKYMYSFLCEMISNIELFSDIFNSVMNKEEVKKYVKDLTRFDEYFNDADDENAGMFVCELLYDKCKNTINLIKHFQREKRVCSITQLINKIYYETDYYYYIKAMPQGKERARNLKLFLDETKKYEQSRTRTLFDFLRFVKRISEKEISLGGDPASESTENMVRIMSIHKSKGLEFPVVFVSGLSKKFNVVDTNSALIIHSDYYVSSKCVNTQKRSSNDSFMRQAVASLMRTEIIAEELRVLYVALTRAKEKLILTGVTSDVVRFVNNISDNIEEDTLKLSHSIRASFDSYLKIITSVFIRSRAFHKAMKNVKKRYNNNGDLQAITYNVKEYIDEPTINYNVVVLYYDDLIRSQLRCSEAVELDRAKKLKMLLEGDLEKELIEALNKNILWVYDDDYLTLQKSKMSVSEIKRLHQRDEGDEGEEEGFYTNRKYKEIIPRFIDDSYVMDAAMRGTWFHKAMELIDNRKLNDDKDVCKELDELFSSVRLPKETREFLTADKISAFAFSKLGMRMRDAALNNKLFKEQKFVVGFPVKEGAPEVVVQGIIDSYFEENGYLVLMDYKTDNINEGQEDILIKRYTTQLDYYKKTLEKITGMKVAEVYLYSFALDKEIKM